jgi:hypothetical protein
MSQMMEIYMITKAKWQGRAPKTNNLAPQGPLSQLETIGGTFGQIFIILIFHCDFLKLLWKCRNILALHKYKYFFHQIFRRKFMLP